MSLSFRTGTPAWGVSWRLYNHNREKDMKIRIPERVYVLYHLLRKILPFGLGMFGLGAMVNSLMLKSTTLNLTGFVPVEMLNEAHLNWVCMNRISYQGDLIMGGLSLLFILIFLWEVMSSETDDTSSELQEEVL